MESRARDARLSAPSLTTPLFRPVVLRLALVLLVAVACGETPLERVGSLMSQGKDREAIKILEILVDEDPQNPELQYAYGWALQRIGRPDRAQWPLRECLDDEQFRIGALRLLAQGALQQQDWDGVFEATDQILEELPEDLSALLVKARAQVLSRTDYEGALETSDRVLEIAPDNVEILPTRTAALLGLERIDDVLEALSTLETRVRDVELGEDGAAHACATKGTFAAERQDFEEARKLFNECFEEMPTSALLTTSAVEFLENINDHGAALEMLEAHVEAAPNSPLKHALASRLNLRGRTDDAEALLRADTEDDDPRVQMAAWLDLLKHFQSLGEWEKGADAAEKALELTEDPDDNLLLEVADSAALAGRPDRALEVANDIESPAFRGIIRGRVALERHDYAEALGHFESGLKLWPNNAVGRYYAAKAAEGLNDWDRAIEEYRWSIRSGAGMTDARARLGLLYDARNQPIAAWEVLRTNLRDAPPDLRLSLVASEIAGRVGQAGASNPVLAGVRTPGEIAQATARMADGVMRSRKDANAAAGIILGSKQLDLSLPSSAPALSKVVELLVQADRADEAKKLVDKAVETYPTAGPLHAVRGEFLARTGESEANVRAALDQAISLAPNNRFVHIALGNHLNEAGDPAAALPHFEAVLANDDEDGDALLGAGAALSAMGEHERAEVFLLDHVEEVPTDTHGAMKLAELDIERGAISERTRRLAQRAVEFGGGEPAEALKAKVDEALGGASEAS